MRKVNGSGRSKRRSPKLLFFYGHSAAKKTQSNSRKVISGLLLLLLTACTEKQIQFYRGGSAEIRTSGRVIADTAGNPMLIGSAASIETRFSGDSCIVQLRNLAGKERHNYFVIELDEVYVGRYRIGGDSSLLHTIKAGPGHSADHLLRVYKATEAQNGQFVIEGIHATVLKPNPGSASAKIEWIGNSITCGMGNDNTALPCGSGEWYDQHNAYWAYGPRTARALGLQYQVSAVSGIGVYRTWNQKSPGLPAVFESAYLSTDSSTKWDFTRFQPDIVSICLGTNDLSSGDGQTPRTAFDSSRFINQYCDFLGKLYQHYTHARIMLLTSPMLSGADARLLFACLQQVQKNAAKRYPDKAPVELFAFSPLIPGGCSYHPGNADHEAMAQELEGFLKTVLRKIN